MRSFVHAKARFAIAPATGIPPSPTVAPAPTSTATVVAPTQPAEFADLLVDALRPEDGGVAMIARLDGEQVQAAVGVADDTGTALAVNSRFRVGSLSKTFVAVAGWSAVVSDAAVDVDMTSIVSSAWSAGALVSSPPDLLVFLEGLFAGKFLSEDSLATMMDMDDSGGVGDGYGLGLMEVPLNGAAFGHGGSIPGYNSLMALNPENNDAVIVLSNSDDINAAQVATQVLSQLMELD